MLPRQNSPVYTLTIPSTNKKVKYRPFLVKEQKSLLIAHASEDVHVMIDTLKNVIVACFQEKIDVDKLATFDLEYIFAQMRAKSVGEVAELEMKCTHCDNTNNVVKVQIDIASIEITRDPTHSNNIPLFDDVGIIMNYPNIDTLNKYQGYKDDVNTVFEIIIECIDCIYDSKESHKASEQNKEDLMEFLENLSGDNFQKIKHFFESVPKLEKHVEFDCPACAAKNHVTIKGISDFFR